MKAKITKYGLLLISLTVAFSCKKSLNEQFSNPEMSKEASVPGLFTGMLNNDRVAAKYWNVRTFLSQMPGIYAQVNYFANANTVYRQNEDYAQQYWDDFYSTGGNGSGVGALYRAMQVKYDASSSADQAVQKNIMQAGKVVLIEQAAKMVDLWGDIPYTEIASLQSSAKITPPKYDDQKALYTSFIKDLGDIAAYFKTAATSAPFSKADILLQGDVKKWERYANSLKLRLLMRVSNVDENMARTEVLKMLATPADYPLIDGNNAALYNPNNEDVLLRPLTDNVATLRDAFLEGSWYATDYMLNTLMAPSNDPRIPVIYDKFGRTANNVFTPNPTYKAMPVTFTSTQQENMFQDFAVLDSATFLFNQKLPGILMTATETNLLKAEANERWGTSTAAKTNYETALRQSVSFYYYLNNLNQGGGYKNEAMPAASAIDNWINSPTISYTGATTDKLKLISIQKWAHFGVLQATEAWSEYRRTKVPVLNFPTEGKTAGFSTPPTRLVYPGNEKSLNSQNYEAVKSEDTRNTKIFWMP